MNISIVYGDTIEDHIPLKFQIILPYQKSYFKNAVTNLEIDIIKYYRWNKAYESDVPEYLYC